MNEWMHKRTEALRAERRMEKWMNLINFESNLKISTSVRYKVFHLQWQIQLYCSMSGKCDEDDNILNTFLLQGEQKQFIGVASELLTPLTC